MSERQYAHYKDMPRQSIGAMANQLWLEDPKMVGIHLARYKFVAKMLAGKRLVAEVGCGDGFYSKVVKQSVGSLFLYDFDPQFVGDAIERETVINLHDILKNPIGNGIFDGIYSLDVMEHIHPAKEHVYLENICKSLVPEGVFICGMPSLESQKYASPASKIGHVNCLSGVDLKRTLENYFHNVFLFSMHDEVISTAFYPMAHYLIGVCAGVR